MEANALYLAGKRDGLRKALEICETHWASVLIEDDFHSGVRNGAKEDARRIRAELARVPIPPAGTEPPTGNHGRV